MVHAVIVFFFFFNYYLSHVNVYLKYVFAFFELDFPTKCVCFLLSLSSLFLGLDHVFFFRFVFFNLLLLKKTKTIFGHMISRGTTFSHGSPSVITLYSVSKNFFPFYFDLAMYLYCL